MKKLPLQLADILQKHIKNPSDKKLLDLNCETGRLAFEASQHFKEVTAIDTSARYIRPAIDLQNNGLLRYVIKDEGELQLFKDVQLEDLGLSKETDNLKFMQDDAMKLKSRYRNYDVIVAVNLLEELTQPKAFLNTIHERLGYNGVLILGSTYDWKTSVCQKDNWLGGFKKDGESLKSIDSITQILSKHFESYAKPIDIKYPIRQSSRHFDIEVSQLSFWRKK